MADPFHLQRFVDAQANAASYQRAVEELRRGQKRTHWIWYVFPQIVGLGTSAISKFFAITSLNEANAYLRHGVLGPRLLECSLLVLASDAPSAGQIFGALDSQKVRSSMTLFLGATPEEAVFQQVLDRYYGGAPDPLTLARL